MKKPEKKIMCDHCDKRIKPKVKSTKVDQVTLAYLRCSKCKTVYPSYVNDVHTLANISEMNELQKQIFDKESIRKNRTELSENEVSNRINENRLLIHKMQKLKQENVLMTRRLINEYMKDFEKLGERVIYNG